MNANRDNQGLQQQPNDAQRPQSGQQNQQADRGRRPKDGVEGADQDGLNTGGVAGGNGDIRPGRTGDGGAER